MKISEIDIEKFESKFKKTDGCWIWQGSTWKDRGNYGRFHVRRKAVRAHRVSWLVYRGSWPSDKFVCHTCDVPACVNPDHLFLGTTTENMRDMINKGRKPSQHGERHPSNKLTESDVRAIRKAYNNGTSQADLHREYELSRASICNIVNGKSWTHI